MKHENQKCITEEFAKLNLVKADTVRRRYCLTGSYFNIVPTKLSNGRLAWPAKVAGLEDAQEVVGDV